MKGCRRAGQTSVAALGHENGRSKLRPYDSLFPIPHSLLPASSVWLTTSFRQLDRFLGEVWRHVARQRFLRDLADPVVVVDRVRRVVHAPFDPVEEVLLA